MANKFIVFAIVVQALSAGTADSCPKIISRAAWGAAPSQRRLSVRPAVGFVVIHHTSSGHDCKTNSECSKAVREIQKFHQKNRNWADIGYNFLIGGDGQIYEGRGWSILGAHASGYNARSVGIAFIGDFSSEQPSSAMVQQASELIACGVSKKYISSHYNLTGHRQLASTVCPGTELYSLVKTWPHYRVKV